MTVKQAAARRTVVVAAHPDDETAGAGALLAHLHDPLVVHLTDGAPLQPSDALRAGCVGRKEYAFARRRELLAALRLAGVRADQTRSLNVTDQEASLEMIYIALRLTDIFREVRPGAVITHPYEGGHPDHDATAFTVHAACALLDDPPELFEFASYHAADGQRAAMETGRFLGAATGQAIALSEEDCERKRRMFECFATQLHTLRHFPVDVEVFRPAPDYDFTLPPHPGKLYYEHFEWGMSGKRWRFLAAGAKRTLEEPLEGPLGGIDQL
jgi:LmbE family N-acetylglucosaminyl deacetylase